MKFLATLTVFVLATLSFADKEKSSGWSDIKSGTMSVIRGASKGIKKAADKVDEKIAANQKEDEEEEKAEKAKKKK